MTAYFALALTFFLWIAENPAAARSPFLAVCFPFRNPLWFLPFLAYLWAKGLPAVVLSLVSSRTNSEPYSG